MILVCRKLRFVSSRFCKWRFEKCEERRNQSCHGAGSSHFSSSPSRDICSRSIPPSDPLGIDVTLPMSKRWRRRESYLTKLWKKQYLRLKDNFSTNNIDPLSALKKDEKKSWQSLWSSNDWDSSSNRISTRIWKLTKRRVVRRLVYARLVICRSRDRRCPWTQAGTGHVQIGCDQESYDLHGWQSWKEQIESYPSAYPTRPSFISIHSVVDVSINMLSFRQNYSTSLIPKWPFRNLTRLVVSVQNARSLWHLSKETIMSNEDDVLLSEWTHWRYRHWYSSSFLSRYEYSNDLTISNNILAKCKILGRVEWRHIEFFCIVNWSVDIELRRHKIVHLNRIICRSRPSCNESLSITRHLRSVGVSIWDTLRIPRSA